MQVFAGDFNEETKRWNNIRREYLYFNEGYESKSLGKRVLDGLKVNKERIAI